MVLPENVWSFWTRNFKLKYFVHLKREEKGEFLPDRLTLYKMNSSGRNYLNIEENFAAKA